MIVSPPSSWTEDFKALETRNANVKQSAEAKLACIVPQLSARIETDNVPEKQPSAFEKSRLERIEQNKQVTYRQSELYRYFH